MVYTYPQNIVFQDSGAFTRELCLDNEFIVPTNNPIGDPECCELYHLPYMAGDLIQFYLPFTPASLSLEDENGNDLSSAITNEDRLIKIDTTGFTAKFFGATIDGNCLEFNWALFNPLDKECCKKLQDDCLPFSTVEIFSTFFKSDLINNRYDLNNGYTNKIRVYAELIETSVPAPEEIRNDRDKLTRKRIRYRYKLAIDRILANSWIFKHLTRSVLIGENIMFKSALQDEFFELKVVSDIVERYERFWFIQIELETPAIDLQIKC